MTAVSSGAASLAVTSGRPTALATPRKSPTPSYNVDDSFATELEASLKQQESAEQAEGGGGAGELSVKRLEQIEAGIAEEVYYPIMWDVPLLIRTYKGGCTSGPRGVTQPETWDNMLRDLQPTKDLRPWRGCQSLRHPILYNMVQKAKTEMLTTHVSHDVTPPFSGLPSTMNTARTGIGGGGETTRTVRTSRLNRSRSIATTIVAPDNRYRERLESFLSKARPVKKDFSWWKQASKYELSPVNRNKREEVMKETRIQGAIGRWWTAVNKINDRMAKQEYLALTAAMYICLTKCVTYAVATQLAEIEWQSDFRDPDREAKVLTYDEFAVSMFDVADNWAETLEIPPLVHFLDALRMDTMVYLGRAEPIIPKNVNIRIGGGAVGWSALENGLVGHLSKNGETGHSTLRGSVAGSSRQNQRRNSELLRGATLGDLNLDTFGQKMAAESLLGNLAKLKSGPISMSTGSMGSDGGDSAATSRKDLWARLKSMKDEAVEKEKNSLANNLGSGNVRMLSLLKKQRSNKDLSSDLGAPTMFNGGMRRQASERRMSAGLPIPRKGENISFGHMVPRDLSEQVPQPSMRSTSGRRRMSSVGVGESMSPADVRNFLLKLDSRSASGSHSPFELLSPPSASGGVVSPMIASPHAGSGSADSDSEATNTVRSDLNSSRSGPDNAPGAFQSAPASFGRVDSASNQSVTPHGSNPNSSSTSPRAVPSSLLPLQVMYLPTAANDPIALSRRLSSEDRRKSHGLPLTRELEEIDEEEADEEDAMAPWPENEGGD